MNPYTHLWEGTGERERWSWERPRITVGVRVA